MRYRRPRERQPPRHASPIRCCFHRVSAALLRRLIGARRARAHPTVLTDGDCEARQCDRNTEAMRQFLLTYDECDSEFRQQVCRFDPGALSGLLSRLSAIAASNYHGITRLD